VRAESDRRIVRGPLRAWLAPGVDLDADLAPGGDVDWLLTHPRCRLVKLQRKVIVGRVTTRSGPLWVKRYTVHALRVYLGSLGHPSPADRAFRAARALEGLGFAVPPPVAALEFRCLGGLQRSFFVTREVEDATTTDARWRALAGRPAGRHALARALGTLLARLHAAGVYHNDLKDVNILVRGPEMAPALVLLDLERVTIGRPPSVRRRRKNLIQLERTLGRLANRAARLRVLEAYLGVASSRSTRRRWARAILAGAASKDRRRRQDTPRRQADISCTVVCQDEAERIAACLESVRWCDEVIVVDGGSRDATVSIASGIADRVLVNPWPGYRAQKQFAFDQARSAWVLSLDADERVPAELAAAIEDVLSHEIPADVAGFRIPRLVPYLGRWWYRGGWYPRPVVRLVRRDRAVWAGTDPHDRLAVRGRVLSLRPPILHYSYENVADHLRSVAKLTAVSAAQVPPGRRVGCSRIVLYPAWRFLRAWILRGAVLEGLPGGFVAMTDAFYVFLRWARVWERERRS